MFLAVARTKSTSDTFRMTNARSASEGLYKRDCPALRAFIAQNDPPDRFVRFTNRSSPPHPSSVRTTPSPTWGEGKDN